MNWGVDAYLDGTWTAITSDVMARAGLSCTRGINGSDITDRVAQTGNMAITLNNAGTLYSPDAATCRTGWGVSTQIRFYLLDGTTPEYKFTGRVSDIEPQYGRYLERGVGVTVVDYMEIPATYKTNLLAMQSSQRADQVIGTVVASLSIQPTATNYIQDNETFAYALHTEQDEKSTAMNVMQKIAQSSLGYIYVTGDDTLTYEPRTQRFMNMTPVGTLSDNMTGLKVTRGANLVYNTIKDTVYPVSIGVSLVVLASSPSEFSIPPAGTVTRTFRYRDPNSGQSRVSGYGVVSPVAGTDYRFSVYPNGSAGESNGSVTVTSTTGANSVSVTVVNSLSVTVYCNLFQVRGYMVTIYDPVEIVKEDATSQATYGERTKVLSQPYQGSSTYADSLTDWLLSKYKDPYSDISEVTFIASTPALESLAINADIGSRIKIIESQTGISKDFFINKVSYKLDSTVLTTSYLLEPAETTTYWILEDATYGVLDVTTRPGP